MTNKSVLKFIFIFLPILFSIFLLSAIPSLQNSVLGYYLGVGSFVVSISIILSDAGGGD